MVVKGLVGQADLRDLSAKVRLRVLEIASENIDNLAVIEPEAREMLENLDVCKARDRLVICRSDAVHQAVLIARIFDADDDRVSRLPLANKVIEHLRRILQIRQQNDDCVALGFENCMMRRPDVAEVARIQDDFDMGIFPRNPA